jgi:hypothetical protein
MTKTILINESKGFAFFAGSTCSSYPMKIMIIAFWKLIVD